jgi:restriction system protein
MAIPEFSIISIELLKFLKDEREHTMKQIEISLTKHFNLSKEDRNKVRSSGYGKVFYNRLHWAKYYLKKAGLLIDNSNGSFRSKKSSVKITSEGLSLLKKGRKTLDRSFLLNYSH